MTLAIGIIFGIWLAVSIINQFRTNALPVADTFSLIPKWTFFAPNPGRHDYHIVYRDYDSQDKPITVWRELFEHKRRPVFSAIWNPEKRYRKAVIDCCQTLIVNRGENTALTIPYLLLLTIVMSKAASIDARARNYAVIATRRLATTPPELVLVSEMHSI